MILEKNRVFCNRRKYSVQSSYVPVRFLSFLYNERPYIHGSEELQHFSRIKSSFLERIRWEEDILSMILDGREDIAVYGVDIHRVIDYDCGDLRILQWNRTGVD